jgi:hypothetical protein
MRGMKQGCGTAEGKEVLPMETETAAGAREGTRCSVLSGAGESRSRAHLAHNETLAVVRQDGFKELDVVGAPAPGQVQQPS